MVPAPKAWGPGARSAGSCARQRGTEATAALPAANAHGEQQAGAGFDLRVGNVSNFCVVASPPVPLAPAATSTSLAAALLASQIPLPSPATARQFSLPLSMYRTMSHTASSGPVRETRLSQASFVSRALIARHVVRVDLQSVPPVPATLCFRERFAAASGESKVIRRIEHSHGCGADAQVPELMRSTNL